MILTGKCKEGFEKWLIQNYKNLSFYHGKDLAMFNDLPPQMCNALIIEYFDSVGVYINIKRFFLGNEFKFWYFTINDENGIGLINHVSTENRVFINSRQEIIIQAIEKANDLINEELTINL
jgi:hypothetical protein